MLRLVLLALAILSAQPARAERGLLTRGTQQATAGERLGVELETPHGLTPPPGIQSERALRGFAARVCREARCVPLAALNVRPRDGWSLVYRAEFSLPRELTAGHYELDVRYPGGLEAVPGGVIVSAAAPPAAAAPKASSGCAVAAEPSAGAPLGLLLLAISRKLAPGWRRLGNSRR
jgi:hypothetical protein